MSEGGATAAAPAPAPSAWEAIPLGAARLGSRLALAWRRQWRIDWKGLGLSLAQELRPRPHRIKNALRIGFIIAAGSGLMTVLTIPGSIGPYILQGIAAGPGALTPRDAATLSTAQSLATGSSIPLIGVLVEAPWLLLCCFAVVAMVLTYETQRGPLGASRWLYIEISFLNTFFLAVFEPDNFGREVAYTFAGGIISFAVVAAFDNWLWPVSARAALVDALVHSLERSRSYMAVLGKTYVQPAISLPSSVAPATYLMPAHLTLLSRATSQGLSARDHAVLLGAITVTERIAIEVERMRVIVAETAQTESGSASARVALAPQLTALFAALERALTCHAQHLRGPLDSSTDRALDEAVGQVKAALAALLSQSDRFLAPEAGFESVEQLGHLSGFIQGMRHLTRLLERAPDELPMPLPADGSKAAAAQASQPAGMDPEALAHAIKTAIAMTLGYVVVLFSHQGELDTAALTIMICALPSYGATLRKMNLRLVGAAAGGVVTLAAMEIVSPNFESLGPYLALLFVVLSISSYIGDSGPHLSYLGKQLGVTFILTYMDLSPSTDIYAPLWRLWGVLLGVVMVGGVFLVLVPDYSARSMLIRLRKLLRLTIDLLPHNFMAEQASSERLETMIGQAGGLIGELLAACDDAGMEGTGSGTHADRVVDACGTLRRMCNRAGDLNRWCMAYPAISAGGLAALHQFEEAFQKRLAYWLTYFEGIQAAGRGQIRFPRPAPPEADELEGQYRALANFFTGAGLAEIQAWPVEARTAWLAQLESCDRLVMLAGELDEQFRLTPRHWS